MCIRLANESKHKKAFPPYVSNMAVAEKILAKLSLTNMLLLCLRERGIAYC